MKTGQWELEFHPPKHDGWAIKITARCSECGSNYIDDPHKWMGSFEEDDNYGFATCLWSGFFTNYSEANRHTIENFAWLNVDRNKLLPFCSKCGAKMGTV